MHYYNSTKLLPRILQISFDTALNSLVICEAFLVWMVLMSCCLFQRMLHVLTDSEEDVKLIYEKLINGIPDLSQRILGKLITHG